ncbi:MAG: ATP-dependent DNA helicase RecG [Candidatus Eremiobacteraeota bacterium]|nr:ATP-dependent DNA helicase RecG [Candidatus Eremiobacteraeota bacterium]MBV8366643.1 ATP-dependent DNA helicase RecG [Candidatus Eremiobacteraeota bacterium]
MLAPLTALAALRRNTIEQFERLGIRSVLDLLRHYPYRYDDLRAALTVAALRALPSIEGEVNVMGVIRHVKHIRLRGRVRAKTTAVVDDGTGAITAVWFGRPYLGSVLKAGQRVFMRGRAEATLTGVQMLVGRHRVVTDDEEYSGELVPVYPLTAGLSNYAVQRLVARALARVGARAKGAALLDPLPAGLTARRRFADALWCVRAIHQPKSLEDAQRARERLIYEEFFLLALAAARRRAARRGESSPDLSSAAAPGALADFHQRMRALLPFRLTGAQERVVDEIVGDLAGSWPMNRLLQGDVGSGKTAVAAAAVLFAVRAGYQAAFMAPTEILAAQQFNSLTRLLSPAGVRVAMLVGALRRSTRDDILDQLRRGELDVVVGTHALLTEDVAFHKLGFVVIDEQHRFGVMQRAALRAKAGALTPHTLVMTATPIPRTLAQTVYADLDISVIDELPPGRKPPKTYLRDVDSKDKIFAFIREQVAQGRQAYIVCPAIDESERAMHTAVKQAERLRAHELAGLRVGLLHGKIAGADKEKIMRMFADGFLHVLIATTVVEVGVDVPNATVMLVFDAHTFGLAQLHQLRGRVGRGAAASYCILVAAGDAEDSARLALLERTNDGFAIAEEDARIRGSGDLLGTRQHGLADLRLAQLVRDYSVFLEAKKDADALVASDPRFEKPENARLAAFLATQHTDSVLLASS